MLLFPSAAKNEADRRQERSEIKRRLTRKVRILSPTIPFPALLFES